jgi:SAM-dependent methyltransferase
MLSVAKAFGAAQYIGLDQGEIDGSHPLQQSDVRFEREAFAPVEVYYHQEDMLSFLARLQTGISTIAINGIDYHVIPDGNYHHALAREIARVLRPGGIAMGIRAMVGYYLEEFGLREMPSITPMEFDRGFHGENFFLEKTGGSR